MFIIIYITILTLAILGLLWSNNERGIKEHTLSNRQVNFILKYIFYEIFLLEYTFGFFYSSQSRDFLFFEKGKFEIYCNRFFGKPIHVIELHI
jgi:hypothetical protein